MEQWSYVSRDLCGCRSFIDTNDKHGCLVRILLNARAFKTPMKLWYCEHLLYYSVLCPSPQSWHWLLSASAPSTVYLTPALILPPFCSSRTRNWNGFVTRGSWERIALRKHNNKKNTFKEEAVFLGVCKSPLITTLKSIFWSCNASLFSLLQAVVYWSGRKTILLVGNLKLWDVLVHFS